MGVEAIKTNKKLKVIKVKENNRYYNNICDKNYSSIEELVKSVVDDFDFTAGPGEVDIDVEIENSCIQFDLSGLPSCCGFIELGELRVSKGIDKNEFIQFLNLMPQFCKGKTIIINTNGKDSSIIYETALAKCSNFTLVKKFRNRDSGNTIKCWMSNNE